MMIVVSAHTIGLQDLQTIPLAPETAVTMTTLPRPYNSQAASKNRVLVLELFPSKLNLSLYMYFSVSDFKNWM